MNAKIKFESNDNRVVVLSEPNGHFIRQLKICNDITEIIESSILAHELAVWAEIVQEYEVGIKDCHMTFQVDVSFGPNDVHTNTYVLTFFEPKAAFKEYDLSDLLETHYEVVSAIERAYMQPEESWPQVLIDIQNQQGTGGKWELAKEITLEFEKANQGRQWDGEFFEEIESFIQHKFNTHNQ